MNLKLYKQILKQAREDYEQAFAWNKPEAGASYHSVSLMHLYHCEALVCALEVFNCDSIGGFDVYRGKEQEKLQEYTGLEGRIKWLEMRRK